MSLQSRLYYMLLLIETLNNNKFFCWFDKFYNTTNFSVVVTDSYNENILKKFTERNEIIVSFSAEIVLYSVCARARWNVRCDYALTK